MIAARLALLTPRERQVLELIVQGQADKDICRELGLGISTVKTYVRDMLKTMRARNRTDAAVAFVRWQLTREAA